MDEQAIGTILVGTAIQVHKELGPGLLESVYEAVLADELRGKGLEVRRQAPIAVYYRERRIDAGFRADLLIVGKVIVELKSVEQLNNAHKKQLLTYLRLSGIRLGYLLNFSAALMKDGIVRMVNKL